MTPTGGLEANVAVLMIPSLAAIQLSQNHDEESIGRTYRSQPKVLMMTSA
jgi:hypothetical protein